MVVEIKKYKITQSVFNQILVAHNSFYYNNKYEILGWCVSKDGKNLSRWIVLYKDKELLKIPYFENKSIYIEEKTNQKNNEKGWYTYYKTHDVYIYQIDLRKKVLIYYSECNNDSLMIISKTKEFLNDVNKKGQFFL